jgi:hypothetical protein
MPDAVSEDAAPGVHYDLLLVVCGCRAACPSLAGFAYDKAIVIVDDEGIWRNEWVFKNNTKAS